MPRLGAHMSVAGGLPRAVARAVAHRCQALQIFAKNASQWRGRPLPAEEIREFRARINASGIAPVVSHGSYLINLASRDLALRRQSLEAMGDELDRAEALMELLRARRRGRTMVLLEHTAGQGTSLGASFGELAAIIDAMHGHARVGVCLDTCHLLASGYDICSPEGYAATFKQFERLIGFERLKVFHLNDSKRPL